MFDTQSLINLLILLVALVMVGVPLYRSYRAGKLITGEVVLDTLKTATNRAEELAKVAETIVQANEQRKREGKLTNEQAYNDALDYVRNWFPLDVPFSDDQIIAAINSAILVASRHTSEIEKNKLLSTPFPILETTNFDPNMAIGEVRPIILRPHD